MLSDAPDEATDRAGSASASARLVAPGLAMAALVVALATQFVITSDADVPLYWLGFGLAAVLIGAALWLDGRSSRARTPDDLPRGELITISTGVEIALALAVFALAAFFRFWRFFDFPSGIWFDEGVIGEDALFIIDHDHFVLWRDTNFGRATLYIYALAASFKVFGYGIFAMRLVPVISGLAAVVAFYFLARWLAGVVPALIATALLAVSRYAVTFSRISWDAAMQPFFEILAVYFFVRAMETASKWRFVLAGVFLAVGLYTYVAFRFVPFVIIMLFLYILATRWRMVRRNISGLVIYAATTVVVFAPLGYYAVTHQDDFLARTRDVNVFREIDERNSYEPLWHNIEASAKMINVEGDRNPRHNLPRAQMLDEVTAALLILGLAACAYAFRDWRKGSIPLWLVLMLLPGALTIAIENPSAIRGVGAIPPMYLLATAGIGAIYGTVPRTRAGVAAFVTLAVVLVAAAVAINYRDFQRQIDDIRVYDSFIPANTNVAKVLAAEGKDRNVYVSMQFDEHPAISILGRDRRFRPYSPGRDLILPYDGRDAVIVLGPNQFGLIPTLKQIYPGLERQDKVDPYDRTRFTTLLVPAVDIERLHRIQTTTSSAATPDEEPTVESQPFGRSWTVADLADGPVDVVWEGFLWVLPRTGGQQIEYDVPGAFTLEVDGVVVGSGDGAGKITELAIDPGERRVRVSMKVERPGDVRMQLVVAGGAMGDFSTTMYGQTVGDDGFQLLLRRAPDFAAVPDVTTRVPFAVSAGEMSYEGAEYRATFTAREAGAHGFALDGNGSAQLFVDDTLIVDSGGAHPPRRAAGTVNLEAGEHVLSIQHVTPGGGDWGLLLQEPGQSDWQIVDGSMLRPLETPFVAPVLAEFVPVWGQGQPIAGIENPQALAVLPNGEIAIAGGITLAYFDPEGALLRSVSVQDAENITDIAALPDGRIVVADALAGGVMIIDQQGQLLERLVGDGLSTVRGVDAMPGTVYGASPSEGAYVVAPLGGSVATLTKLSQTAASQPSDVVAFDDGTVFVADFEGTKVYIFQPDGSSSYAIGAGGSGEQVPRLTAFGGLMIMADPLTGRLVAYDRRGEPRGSYVFSPLRTRESTRPGGIDVTPEGVLYAVDIERGLLLRFRVVISPELAAELDQQVP